MGRGRRQFHPGDKIRVEHLTRTYEGEFVEESHGIVILKLHSGYNVAFKKKNIDIKLIKHREKTKTEKSLLKMKPGKPNIAMIITGGTISARVNAKTGGVDWLDSPENMFKFYPEIFNTANVIVSSPFMKASEDMNWKDWKKIAQETLKFLNQGDIQGVIITHGTDFLHYTSAALSFFLRELTKPVVLTYSQRSIDRASSDAALNLECAAKTAVSDIAEVVLVGHASMNDDFCYAMPGTKVRKMHTSRRDTFRVVNAEPFAKVTPEEFKPLSQFQRRRKGKTKLDAKFEERVALIKIFPGQDPDILDFYLKNKYRGLVLELSGLGHAPTKRAQKAWTPKLKEIIKKGMVVCAAPQTIYGRLDPWVYANGREIMNTGVIYLEDILPETALVKLGWVLGKTKNKEKAKEMLLENFAHEFNRRLGKRFIK